MADTVSTSNELQIKCIFQDENGERTSRTLTVDEPKTRESDPTVVESMLNLKQDLISGGLSKVVQPSSWRDTSGDEGALSTVDVEFTYVTTSKTTVDLSETPTGTLQIANLSPQTATASSFSYDSEGQGAPQFTFDLSGYSFYSDVQKSLSGSLPIDYSSYNFDYEEESGTATVTLTFEGDQTMTAATGSDTLEFTITVNEGGNSASATVTITGADQNSAHDL